MRRTGTLALPFLAGLTLMIVVPAIAAVVLAFTDYSGLARPEFTGTDNFTRLFGDETFWRAAGNTAIHVALSVPLRVVAAVGLALLLHDRFPGVGAARASVYLPSVVPDAAYALLWLWLLNPLFGPIAGLASAFGGEGPSLLTDPWGARLSVALMGAFQIGEGLVIALAARRAISPALYDIARVNGATPWFTLKRVTLPLMAPVLLLLTVRDVVLSLQINFIPALLLTDGGPRQATTYLPLFAYRQAFRYFRLGYASTIALSMFVITAITVFVSYRIARRYRLF